MKAVVETVPQVSALLVADETGPMLAKEHRG
jgi:hypothetical protein